MINQQQQIQAVRISRLVFVLESVQEKYAADVGLRVLIYRCARDAMQVCECAAERPRRFPEERISRSFYTLDTRDYFLRPSRVFRCSPLIPSDMRLGLTGSEGRALPRGGGGGGL